MNLESSHSLVTNKVEDMKINHCIATLGLLMATGAMLTTNHAMAQDLIIWNGGIGEDERALAPETGIRLSFFVQPGNYLSKVAVQVRDGNENEIVNVVTDGPWLILDLDPGRYQVIATSDYGAVQSLVIDVSGTTEEFGFAFPEGT